MKMSDYQNAFLQNLERENRLLKREVKALEDDNFQKCDLIAELKETVENLQEENHRLRQIIDTAKGEQDDQIR